MEVEINATESIQRESNPTVNDVDRFDNHASEHKNERQKSNEKEERKRYNAWTCDNAFI